MRNGRAEKLARLIDDHFASGDVETAKMLLFLRNLLMIKQREVQEARLQAAPYVGDYPETQKWRGKFEQACSQLRKLHRRAEGMVNAIDRLGIKDLADQKEWLKTSNKNALKFLANNAQRSEDLAPDKD